MRQFHAYDCAPGSRGGAMVRLILTGVLVGWVLVVTPTARALPRSETCPPTCDTIPATAWPAVHTLPLADDLHWPDLADLAVPVRQPRFYSEELCATPLPTDDPRSFVVAARAEVTAPPGQWQMRAQVLHWRGETWRGGEMAMSVFDFAVAALRACAVPGLSPSITTVDDVRMAAVISGPTIAHQYLVAHPQSSSITELVVWRTVPSSAEQAVPWAPVADGRVLDAITAPLCEAYLSSCG
ncbi:hypothetical protein BVC93_08345 [Mycobacterium sp. MS1601]|nr:hypothetical protein BVC93_08345 [Mycobacterium sp. MS1601]